MSPKLHFFAHLIDQVHRIKCNVKSEFVQYKNIRLLDTNASLRFMIQVHGGATSGLKSMTDLHSLGSIVFNSKVSDPGSIPGVSTPLLTRGDGRMSRAPVFVLFGRSEIRTSWSNQTNDLKIDTCCYLAWCSALLGQNNKQCNEEDQ